MVGSEIRETLNIAVSAMILAVLLSFIVYMITLSRGISTAYNNEVYVAESLSSYHEFSHFDGNNKLSGLDVISAIRDYADSSVEILVRNRDGDRVYNKTSAVLDKDSISIKTLECLYYTPSTEYSSCKRGSMDYEYRAVLVYGHENIQEIDVNNYVKPSLYDTGVTGIIFYEVNE